MSCLKFFLDVKVNEVCCYRVQFSPHERDSKNGIVDSPRSSATPENEGTAEEAASAAASEEANDDFFVPAEVGQEGTEECSEPSRKRSYGGGVSSKKKKNDSLQEGWNFIIFLPYRFFRRWTLICCAKV